MAESSKRTTKQRGPGKPFQPGVSGNPGGRPKVLAEIKDLAREHTEKALLALVDVLDNPKAPPAAKVGAACALLDRGYGKPTQTIDAQVTIFDRMTTDEQRSLAAALQSLADDTSGDADGTATTH